MQYFYEHYEKIAFLTFRMCGVCNCVGTKLLILFFLVKAHSHHYIHYKGEKQVFAAANMINKQGVPGKNIGE